MKIFNVLVLLFTGVNTFSNWNDKIFVANRKEDIKVIDKVQINVISKLWYEQILGKDTKMLNDDDYDEDYEENSHEIYIALNKALKQRDRMNNNPVLKQINMLESIYLSCFNILSNSDSLILLFAKYIFFIISVNK